MNIGDIAEAMTREAKAHGLGYLICLLDHASDGSVILHDNVDSGDVLLWFDTLTHELDFSRHNLLEIMKKTEAEL